MTTPDAAEITAPESIRILGARGLKNLGGRVQEEYLNAIRDWKTRVKLYLEMRDDPTIGTLLDAIKLPLLASDFNVEPFSEDERDMAASDFLWDNMQQMDRQSWRSHTSDMLDALDFGWALSEITLEKREDGRLWLANVDPRGQETLDSWGFDEHDHTTSFRQRDPDTGRLIVIPLDKTVHFTFRGRKGNPEGWALLRSLMRPWRMAKDLENYEGIGIERDVGGMPVFTLEETLDTYAAQDITDLQNAAIGLRMDEQSYLILQKGTTVTPYAGGSKAYDIGAVIERKHREILMRFFAQFLALGMNNVGTQALVRGSHDFFMLALRSIQQQLLETWNQQLVPFLFRFNVFPGITGLPRISWNEPGKIDISALLQAYSTGVTARVITPTQEDEEDIRAKMDLPDLPEGEGVGEREIEAPAEGLFGDWAAEVVE